ncbi:MAG: hypothetical protein RI101_00215 [Nitrospira sp.]|jgi:hypothetical protein|nr:hypothetical protein [Nitrospira sp.]
MSSFTQSEDEKLFNAILRINSKMFGLVLGLLAGSTIFIATNWLVLKGGQISEGGHVLIGPHLQLLSQFFLGYSVSFVGSLIGFAYGFACGTLAGAAIGSIYNKLVQYRNPKG